MSTTVEKRHTLDIQKLANFGDNGIDIVDSDVYHIVDMEIKDLHGFVKQTISRTTLYPNKTTRGHMHPDKEETYYFEKGEGLIILQGEDYNGFYHIEPETWLFIPKEIFHQVVNVSKNENLEFTTFYPGASSRPPIPKEEKGKKK